MVMLGRFLENSVIHASAVEHFVGDLSLLTASIGHEEVLLVLEFMADFVLHGIDELALFARFILELILCGRIRFGIPSV